MLERADRVARTRARARLAAMVYADPFAIKPTPESFASLSNSSSRNRSCRTASAATAGKECVQLIDQLGTALPRFRSSA